MDPRISIVTLGVADLSRALRFYRDGLGWPLSSASGGDIAFLRTGGVVLALYPRTHLAADANLSPISSGFGGITLAHNVLLRDDVDRILTEAVTAGGTLLKAAEEASWGGYSGYFADPDGYPWEVAWNPGFPFNADGSLHLPDDVPQDDNLLPSLGRAEFLAVLEASQHTFDTALAGMTDSALDEIGVVEGWSTIDLVGHVTDWEMRVVHHLENWQQGLPPLPETEQALDEGNARAVMLRRGWTHAQVTAEAAHTHQRLYSLLSGITDEEWISEATLHGRIRTIGAWVGGATNGDNGPGTHAAEHARHIANWRHRVTVSQTRQANATV